MSDTTHRPWRVPDEPWANAQSWLDLAFLHWRVAATDARSSVVVERRYRLPYPRARMACGRVGDRGQYDSERSGVVFHSSYRGDLFQAEPGCLECLLTGQDAVVWSLAEI